MWLEFVLPAVAAFLAGGLNSVAGGGSFLTFPVLVLSGQGELAANATSTLALWPGSVASVFGYRREVGALWSLAKAYAAVSLAGGLLGVALVVHTPSETFAAVLPFLLLAATLVFTFGPAFLRARPAGGVTRGALAVQFVVGVYGGYFGGGIGLLMLASFTLLGLTDIHAMNGLKALLGTLINAMAVVGFAVAGLVAWRVGLVMAVAAVAGGYGGAALFRRLPAEGVRRAVVGLSWVMTALFFARRFA